MSKVKPKSLSLGSRAPAVTYIGAAQFKATCLQLLDRVRESGEDIVVTKHGKPVAKVVRYTEPAKRRGYIGCMKGTVLRYDRPLDPLDEVWDADQPTEPADR